MSDNQEQQKKPSAGRSRGKGAVGNLGESTKAPLSPKRRISRATTPRGNESGKSQQRQAQNVDRENCEVKERPFTALTDQRRGSLVKPYSSSIKVNGGPSYSSWKETTAPSFRPTKRLIPEFNPEGVGWRPSRRHPCSRQCNHQQSEVAFIYQPELLSEKENTVPPFRPRKRYIPEFYPKGKEWKPSRMHLCSKQCAHKQQDEDMDYQPHRSSVKLVKGPQHYSVEHGDATFRPLEPGREIPRTSKNLVRKPMAPQGRLNEYIIDGHFHKFKQPKELLTEQMAQFVNCKPWIRQGIFEEVTKAYKENGFRATSVDPSVTRHLYEDRTSLVNRRPSTAAGHILHCNSQKSSTVSIAPLHITKSGVNSFRADCKQACELVELGMVCDVKNPCSLVGTTFEVGKTTLQDLATFGECKQRHPRSTFGASRVVGNNVHKHPFKDSRSKV